MPSTSIRIDENALTVLKELALKQHLPLQTVLKQAVDSYRRKQLLDDANAAFAALRSDPQAWGEEQQERKVWDQAISDGLE